MKRYFLEKNRKGIVPAIHTHSSQCHWVRLDEEIIFGLAEMQSDHFTNAWDHEHIFVFPSMHDMRPLEDKLKEQGFTDMVETIERYGVTKYEPALNVVLHLTDKLDDPLLELHI